MKKWVDKKILAGLFIITVFIIPLIVNCLFKIKAPFEILAAEWGADAALTYCGAIIAGIIAVYGVFITIQYSQNNYREDVRNRIMPFIIVDILNTRTYYDYFNEKPIEKNDKPKGYFEYKLKAHFCVLEKGEIKYKKFLEDKQIELLNGGGVKKALNKNCFAIVQSNHICIPIVIENVGNGVAIKLNYGVAKKDTASEERRYLKSISFKTNEVLELRIFSEDCGSSSNNLGDYILYFDYEDVLGNSYTQEFNFNIHYDEISNSPGFSLDMNSEQIYLGGRNNGQNENGNT